MYTVFCIYSNIYNHKKKKLQINQLKQEIETIKSTQNKEIEDLKTRESYLKTLNKVDIICYEAY